MVQNNCERTPCLLEEELAVDIDSFKIHDELDPQIWNNEKIDPEIRKKLIKIANDFIDGLPIKVNVQDITLTGSLANFNWSKYSDVDLHIIVDFGLIDENEELVKGFFDGQRMRWNDIHDITIKDYDVEIYVENSGEDHKSTGVYSVMNDEWIKHPQYIEQTIDFETAKKKASSSGAGAGEGGFIEIGTLRQRSIFEKISMFWHKLASYNT